MTGIMPVTSIVYPLIGSVSGSYLAFENINLCYLKCPICSTVLKFIEDKNEYVCHNKQCLKVRVSINDED